MADGFLRVWPPDAQAFGTLMGGKLRERKPLGFPGEAAPLVRVGPLFYWAWADAAEPAELDEHPHQAFEILTYVLAGELEHRDSLGNVSRVGAGGAQVMQTGSGIWHGEKILLAPASLFQIWLEPKRKEAVKQAPRYFGIGDGAFPRTDAGGGVVVKTVLGPGAPVALAVDARMVDVTLPAGNAWHAEVAQGRALAAMVVDGTTAWRANGGDHGETTAALDGAARSFVLADADAGALTVRVEAPGGAARIVAIDVPLAPGYPLYHKSRPKLPDPA